MLGMECQLQVWPYTELRSSPYKFVGAFALPRIEGPCGYGANSGSLSAILGSRDTKMNKQNYEFNMIYDS
jgi:hypothetical protein